MRTEILRTTVTGSYPRPQQPGDTLRKPALTREQADELIRWAVTDQVEAGLDVVTDGEGRRENMYYFFQKRMNGVSFAEMEYRKYGPLGFGIEIAKVVSRLEDPQVGLAHDWKVARDAAPRTSRSSSPARARTCSPSFRIIAGPTCIQRTGTWRRPTPRC